VVCTLTFVGLVGLYLLPTVSSGRTCAGKGHRGGDAERQRRRGATALRALLAAAALASGGAQVEVSTLAGSGAAAFVNDVGTGAAFNQPRGVAVNAVGNVYVADEINHLIRAVSPLSVVSTLAGSGTGTHANGAGTSASFRNPWSVAIGSGDNVFVADVNNHRIRKVTPGGVVSTLAGSGVAGYFDNAVGTSARFYNPSGVTVDASGNLFVADEVNHRIRKVTSTGSVSFLAGRAAAAFANGVGSNAQFSSPRGVAVNSNGVFVADTGNHRIRLVTLSGSVSTLAGSGTSAFANGAGAAASFNQPHGVAVGASGDVFVGDYGNSCIRMVTLSGVVSTLAGSGAAAFGNGVGSVASFAYPHSVAIDTSGNVFVADFGNHRIRKLSCAAGTYSATGVCCCTPCPEGTYGATAGLTAATCSGPCSAG
jgi:sugar lactone lactonase YvrE